MNEIYVKTNGPPKANSPLAGGPSFALEGVLFIPNMKRYERLSQQDIQYVKGDRSHVTLHLVNGKKLSVSTHLGNFMRYLNAAYFVRTSRSHVVNLGHIQAVTSRSVVLADKVIPLTETYRTILWERLTIVRLKSD